MLKAIGKILILTTLMAAFMAPPIVSLFDTDTAVLIINKEKRELDEKESEEKTIFFNDLTGAIMLPTEQITRSNSLHNNNITNTHTDIFLPPPEVLL